MKALALAALFALGGCGDDGISRVEVARVAAPDGKADAVVVEVNAGATAAFVYDVFVLPQGATPAGEAAVSLHGATRNAQAYGVNLHWQDATHLDIAYLQAKQVLRASETVPVAGKAVQITLTAGVNDPDAPAGGMEYSQQHGATP